MLSRLEAEVKNGVAYKKRAAMSSISMSMKVFSMLTCTYFDVVGDAIACRGSKITNLKCTHLNRVNRVLQHFCQK